MRFRLCVGILIVESFVAYAIFMALHLGVHAL